MQPGLYGQLGHSDLIKLLKERDTEILALQFRLAQLPPVESTYTATPIKISEASTTLNTSFKKFSSTLFKFRNKPPA